MSMPHLLCNICDEAYVPDKFLTQHCGHVFCKYCISKLSNGQTSEAVTCPACRTPWGSQTPFRLYLDFAVAPASARLYDRLENMGGDTPSVFADRTSDIMRKFVEESGSTHNTSESVALLNAAEHLEKRVIPLFSNLERVRDENSLLRQQLAACQLDIQSKESLVAQIEQMNRAMTDQSQTLLSIRDELAREKKKRSSEEKANHRLVHSLRKKQEEMKVKEREIESIRSAIEERDKQLHLQKRKLREVAKRSKPAPVVQDVDDSLVVEPPLSDIVNDNTLQKPREFEANTSNRPFGTRFLSHKYRKTDS